MTEFGQEFGQEIEAAAEYELLNTVEALGPLAPIGLCFYTALHHAHRAQCFIGSRHLTMADIKAAGNRLSASGHMMYDATRPDVQPVIDFIRLLPTENPVPCEANRG